ncbi:MAG: DNA-directed RNA polymerase subunit omega [SAR324 cluster bacterium]|nr:DNA-directed RNA polymerase subunit omega [SAR324 cluster bacterium]MCH8886296.1 DNA-directed RNA polymerase subunit omega [SAR324 cluster bacterium]
MSYLDLVEEFPIKPSLTQFEKILIAVKRAKDLHEEDKVQLVFNHHTSPYLALQEIRDGLITPVYREEEPPVEQIQGDADDGDEED